MLPEPKQRHAPRVKEMTPALKRLSLTTFADELEYGERVDLPDGIGTLFRQRSRKMGNVRKRNGTLLRERIRYLARSLTSWPARRPGH
jgi:hypothetical protein